MSGIKKTTTRVPDRVSLAAQFEDVEETDAGWTFAMWAQYFNIVNDRCWRFKKGSFSKTIRERVKSNRVKVHDGHNWAMNATGTIGRVLTAEELPEGVRYKGFLNRSHEGIASKLADGTISENSVEIYRMKAVCVEVPIDDIPRQCRGWVEITPDGKARIQEVTEVMWLAVGLVSGSSQDKGAMIEPPTLVSYQDLPVKMSRWDPEAARQRIQEYAAAGEGTDFTALSRAHLVQLSSGECLGQIADIDDDGRLVVVAEALGAAYADIAAHLEAHLRDPEAVRLTLAGAADRLARYTAKLSGGLTNEIGGARGISDTGADAPPAPQAAEPRASTPAEPLAASTHSEAGNEAAAKLDQLRRRIQLQALRQRAEQGVRSEPTGTSRRGTETGATGLVGGAGPGGGAPGASR